MSLGHASFTFAVYDKSSDVWMNAVCESGLSSRYTKDWLLQLNSRRTASSNNSSVDHRSPCSCSDYKEHPSSRSHHARYAKSTLASHPGESNVQTLFAHVQYLLASRPHLHVLIDQRALKSDRESWTSINIPWWCAVVPKTNRNYGKRAFAVAGPTAWNSLPVQIRRANTVKKFKSALKTHLFSLHYP